ncbi:hypothetical protein BC829DRAFT_429187 [Chytridium lagenaria]|nr:hypothetical protein BC829DRAFT_429187 [Chytridium lagenaria]
MKHSDLIIAKWIALTKEAEIAGEIIESNFPSFTGPNKMITRPMDSRVSLRIPKGFITLSAEPAAAVSEFGSELSRFKKLEELYEEIMKTVNGFHLETSDGDRGPVFTPAHPKKASPIPEEDEEERDEDIRSRSPSIRLRTRDRNDRLTAMRKTPSSRYNVLKYNYGGYIPYDIDKKKKKKVEVFTPSDYTDYLRTRTCDFIMDLWVDREKDEEEMRKVLEEQDNGMWNAGTLDYMEEIQQPRISQEENEFEPIKAASNGHKSPSQLPSNGHDTNNAEHVSSVSPKPSPLPPKKQQSMPLVGTGLDIHEAQNHLESLWIALKMPVDQKVDMAIKYGSAKFALKLQTAIELWETARNYITDRENLLKEIEQLEIVASDPQRFFKKGYDGSSEARLVESRHREEYLRKLHYFEARRHDVTSMIKSKSTRSSHIKLKRAAEKIEIGVARSRSMLYKP